ncbi:MAG: diacylglycerol/lipid kinase family protein [Bacteroidia bacterium]
MSDSRHFYFIINPISGGRSKKSAVQSIIEIMNENQLEYGIGWWEKGIEVADLVKEGIARGFNTMVAVGGDGTINQIANEIVNTDLVLGIIPFGSGNGFARHLSIRGSIDDHLQILLDGEIKTIDTGTCNGQFFINVAGIGFDAHVSHLFANTEGRGLANYAKVSLTEARLYPEETYELTIDGKKSEESAFLISIANGSQWGNEFYIAPEAELNDGQLRCCLLKKPTLISIPGLVRRLLKGHITESKYYKQICFKNLKIKRKTSGPVHLDGEPILLNEDLEFKVVKNSLKVIS